MWIQRCHLTMDYTDYIIQIYDPWLWLNPCVWLWFLCRPTSNAWSIDSRLFLQALEASALQASPPFCFWTAPWVVSLNLSADIWAKVHRQRQGRLRDWVWRWQGSMIKHLIINLIIHNFNLFANDLAPPTMLSVGSMFTVITRYSVLPCLPHLNSSSQILISRWESEGSSQGIQGNTTCRPLVGDTGCNQNCGQRKGPKETTSRPGSRKGVAQCKCCCIGGCPAWVPDPIIPAEPLEVESSPFCSQWSQWWPWRSWPRASCKAKLGWCTNGNDVCCTSSCCCFRAFSVFIFSVWFHFSFIDQVWV